MVFSVAIEGRKCFLAMRTRLCISRFSGFKALGGEAGEGVERVERVERKEQLKNSENLGCPDFQQMALYGGDKRFDVFKAGADYFV